jgi:hypothetical protein
MSLGPNQHVPLDRDTIAVLFDLLARWTRDSNMDDLRPNLEHEAKAWALNDLFCMLETVAVHGVPGGVSGARARLMAFHGDLDFPS